jgi:hypothetical protein
MSASFLSIPWFVWGFPATVVAAVFLFVWPRGKATGGATGLRYLILRWFHPLVWALLAASFFLRGGDALGGAATAKVLALLALVAYLTFMLTLLRK